MLLNKQYFCKNLALFNFGIFFITECTTKHAVTLLLSLTTNY